MFIITLEQVIILSVFIIAGFLLAKCGIADAAHSKTLSALTIYLFLPCLCLSNFAKNCTPAYLAEKYPIVLLSAGFLALLHFVTPLIAKPFSKNHYEVSILRYTLTIPNYGYTGYALCAGLFGELALLDMMIFTLPMAIYTHSYGYNILTKQDTGKFNMKKLLNPVIIGVLLGCVVGLTGIKLPNVASTIIDKAGACTAPISMLLAGITISEFDIKALLTEKRAYIMSFLRLLGIPLVMFAILKLTGLSSFLATTMLVFAMPCGMNTIVYPKLIGEDCKLGASMALISTVLSLVTIPLCITFLT